MTERPFVGGADTTVGPTPGYYPDPSVPGFVRYWGGSAWVPGTSRPAPSEGEVLEPPRFAARQTAPVSARYVPPPVAAPPVVARPMAEWLGADPLDLPAARTPGSAAETGPVYFDQTSGGASFTLAPHAELELRPGPDPEPEPEPEPEPLVLVEDASAPQGASSQREANGWQADPKAQRGLLEAEDAPRWVSWGALATGPAEPVEAPALAPVPAPEPAPPVEVRPAPTRPLPEPKAVPEPTAAVPEPMVVAEPKVLAQGSIPQRPTPQRPTSQRPTPRRPVPRPAAGLVRRLLARVVDTAVMAVVAVGTGLPLLSSALEHLQAKLEQARAASELTGREVQVWLVDPVVLGKVGVLLGVLVLVGVLYEVLPTARTGQTFGKRLAGVRVVDSRARGRTAVPPTLGRSAVRWLVRQLAVLLVIGLVWPLFGGKARRGWQDRAARTRVVRA